MGVEEFKKEYLPYQRKLYNIAFRLLENSFDAEDIVQEAYIKLWDKRKDLRHVENRESYCMVLIKNLCLDFIRTNKRYTQRRPSDEIIVVDDVQLPEQIDARDEAEYVKTLINLLPEQQKKVLLLKHYDGYSNEEIEEITGFSDVHIRVLLSRGRKKMKELFTRN